MIKTNFLSEYIQQKYVMTSQQNRQTIGEFFNQSSAVNSSEDLRNRHATLDPLQLYLLAVS